MDVDAVINRALKRIYFGVSMSVTEMTKRAIVKAAPGLFIVDNVLIGGGVIQ
jgi:hypothetical protein